jgi:hypothetical protein
LENAAIFQPETGASVWSGLAQKDSLALVRQIERDVTLLPDDIVQEIVSCSDGVPLFLEEVTRTVLAASADVLRPRIWRIDRGEAGACGPLTNF